MNEEPDKKPTRKEKAHARKLREEYLLCRTLGHNWTKEELVNRTLVLVCVRCGMERTDRINHWGRVWARYYTQPEGYRDPDLPDRNGLRSELVRRLEE